MRWPHLLDPQAGGGEIWAMSRAPAFTVIVTAALGLAFAVLMVVLACRQPHLGLSFAGGGHGRTLGLIAAGKNRLELPARLHALTAADGRRMTLRDADLLDDPDFIQTYPELDDFFDRQSRLHDLLASGPLSLELRGPGGEIATASITPHRRGPGDLPGTFWALIGTGLVALIIGAWVWALRPREAATGLFALAGAGLALSLYPIALYSSREIALPGGLFLALLEISVTGAWLMGAGLISLFLVYPVRLAGPRLVGLCFALCMGVPVLRLLRLSPSPLLLAQLSAVIALAMLIAVITLQWRATRPDPRQRTVVRWFGASVGLGCALFVAMVNLPTLFGMPAAIPQGYAVIAFLLIYGGAALGVARYRLFALDALAFRILLLLLAGAVIVGMDALMVYGLHMASGPSIGLAFLATLLLYLPLREAMWRRLAHRRTPDRTLLFQLITQAALEGGNPQMRWEQLLRHLFDPLEMAPLDPEPQAPRLRDEGLTLDLPAVAGAGPMRLRHARGGRGLFGPADLQLAAEIMTLLETAHQRRGAYEQGVQNERLRIARDLHDDVGARLLSALHMAENGVRPLLHAALDDIRAIVSGLGGERKPFGRVIADLRHETARRLEALGIVLDWPSPGEAEADIPLSYGAYKNLSSAVRELMSNVMRHAQASRVTVRITCEPARIAATIRDDGKGHAAGRNGARRGNGLVNLRTRMASLGGSFTIDFAERGTEARFWFPLQATPNAPEQGVQDGTQPAMVRP